MFVWPKRRWSLDFHDRLGSVINKLSKNTPFPFKPCSATIPDHKFTHSFCSLGFIYLIDYIMLLFKLIQYWFRMQTQLGWRWITVKQRKSRHSNTTPLSLSRVTRNKITNHRVVLMHNMLAFCFNMSKRRFSSPGFWIVLP